MKYISKPFSASKVWVTFHKINNFSSQKLEISDRLKTKIVENLVFQFFKEYIMREKVRKEECDTTTHLIKIHVFTHASRVTKFSVWFFLPRYKELEDFSMSTYITKYEIGSYPDLTLSEGKVLVTLDHFLGCADPPVM